MPDVEPIRHDSFFLCRDGFHIRLEIEGHYIEVLPEMALDLADNLKTVATRIIKDGQK